MEFHAVVGSKVTLKLGSQIDYVDLVHEMTEDLARGARFPKPAAMDIALAVREAFINAVKHGNEMDAGKTVEVEFEHNETRFRVRVRDEGAGFDADKTTDPCEEANISKPCGRGIFFMKHFVDRVAFQRLPTRGTEVLLEKQLDPAAGDDRAIRRRNQ